MTVSIRRLVPVLFLVALSACADRTTIPSDEADTEAPAPGEPLSECIDIGDCFDEWCLHPANETGFCTYACSDAQSCEPGYGGTATPTCLAVGSDSVCALDCGNNKSCPSGMRCEQIEAGDEPRSICF